VKKDAINPPLLILPSVMAPKGGSSEIPDVNENVIKRKLILNLLNNIGCRADTMNNGI